MWNSAWRESGTKAQVTTGFLCDTQGFLIPIWFDSNDEHLMSCFDRCEGQTSLLLRLSFLDGKKGILSNVWTVIRWIRGRHRPSGLGVVTWRTDCRWRRQRIRVVDHPTTPCLVQYYFCIIVFIQIQKTYTVGFDIKGGSPKRKEKANHDLYDVSLSVVLWWRRPRLIRLKWETKILDVLYRTEKQEKYVHNCPLCPWASNIFFFCFCFSYSWITFDILLPSQYLERNVKKVIRGIGIQSQAKGQ